MTTTDEKIKARRQLRWALESGKLTRLPCEVCGLKDSYGHHHDYSLPLDVEWLCRQHHADKHRIYPIVKQCLNCGADFIPHRTKRARAKSCSPACRGELISKATIKRYQDPKERQLASERAIVSGAAERGKTLVLFRWNK